MIHAKWVFGIIKFLKGHITLTILKYLWICNTENTLSLYATQTYQENDMIAIIWMGKLFCFKQWVFVFILCIFPFIVFFSFHFRFGVWPIQREKDRKERKRTIVKMIVHVFGGKKLYGKFCGWYQTNWKMPETVSLHHIFCMKCNALIKEMKHTKHLITFNINNKVISLGWKANLLFWPFSMRTANSLKKIPILMWFKLYTI